MDTKKSKKRIIKFIGIFILGIGLLWLIRLIFWENNMAVFTVNNAVAVDSSDNVIASQQRNLLLQDEVLHIRLNELQKLDEAYSSMLTDTANKNGLIEINARISSAEETFRESIDSVANAMLTYPNRIDEYLFVNMIASFRLALENRRSINNLRNAIGTDKTILNTDEKTMLKVKNDLLARDTRIAYLENKLESMLNDIDKSTPAPVNIVNNEKSPILDKTSEKDNKIANLTATNYMLQKEYDRMAKQLSEAGKNRESNDYSVKSRNISLEHKIDDLNTELRLAQVDCNLARVDASQIISNSKQRRLLLSEALAILTSLSKSGNGDIQKKVQDKITRLNQVATNYRD